MEAVEGDDMELYTVDVCVFSVWVCLLSLCVSSLCACVFSACVCLLCMCVSSLCGCVLSACVCLLCLRLHVQYMRMHMHVCNCIISSFSQ